MTLALAVYPLGGYPSSGTASQRAAADPISPASRAISRAASPRCTGDRGGWAWTRQSSRASSSDKLIGLGKWQQH